MVQGALLGNYRVVEQLGQGGMGVVYVGRHEQLGHRVVVKVLRPEMSRNAILVRRFFNEAQAATAIRNPGIVQVFDFGHTPDGRAYFVMELLEGVTLGERLDERPLEIAECCRLARQMANVLQSAHELGITHRDLKPDNLFLVPDAEVAGGERVKVLDFGIAKLAGELQAAGVQTRVDLVMGTPSYMSPEQCRGASAADNRSDIYSLGCVLFKMVCGRAPFVGTSAGDIIGAQLHVPPPALQDRAPGAPLALAALVARMLEKHPDARPQTMAAVAHELEDILRELAAPPARGAMPLDGFDSRLSQLDTASLTASSMMETAPASQQPAVMRPSPSMLETAPVQSGPLSALMTATTTATTVPQDSTVRTPAQRFAETMPLPALHVLLPVPARTTRPGTGGRPLPGVASAPRPMAAIATTAPPGGSPGHGSSRAPSAQPIVMAPAPAPPPGGSPMHGFSRAPSAQPIVMAPAPASRPGGNPAPRLVPAPNAQPMHPFHSTSTTLGDAAGVSSVQRRVDTSRRTRLMGVLAIAMASALSSIAVVVASDQEGGNGATASSSPERAGSADTAIESAIPPPPPPPTSPSPSPSSPSPSPPSPPSPSPSSPSPPSPPGGPGSAAAQTSPPQADDLESECNGFLVDHQWVELEQCADRLMRVTPQRAAALKDRAVGETRTAPHVVAADAALRDRDLVRARAELDQVWTESVDLPLLKARYAVAEAQAITELTGQLAGAMSPTCVAYNEVLDKERGTQPPSVITEASRRVGCTPVVRGRCDATALAEQGRARHAAGKLVPALWSYEASLYCKGDPQTAKRGFIVACNIPHAWKAKQFWKRLPPDMKPTVIASCVNNKITEQQLNQ